MSCHPLTRCVVALATVALLSVASAHAQALHVDDSASGAANGTSWQDAFTSLQDALALAGPGDQIWVAEGTYRPTPTLDRSVSFVLGGGVEVYGGFNGTEFALADRAGRFEATILSGDLQGDDGPDWQGRADNSYHVVTHGGATLVLDGFWLRGGNANGPNGLDQVGGALTVEVFFLGTFRNCLFADNESTAGGGAVYSGFTAETYTRCDFVGNRSGGPGGAVLDQSTQTGGISFTRCRFHGNVAGQGGGGAVHTYQSWYVGCVFTGNVADGTADGGGALFGGSISLDSCTLVGNRALGSALGCGGVAAQFPRSVHNSILWGNLDSSGDAQGAQFQVRFSTALLDMSHSLIEGYDGTLSTEWNLSGDPRFASVAGPDGVLGTLDDDPSLTAISPCLDVGSSSLYGGPSADITGAPRFVQALACDPVGGVLDIGAYEFQSYIGAPTLCATTASSTGWPIELSASCSPSIAANDLVFHTTPMPPGVALLVASRSLDRSLLGGGTFCLGAPIVRSTPIPIGTTTPPFPVDLSSPTWMPVSVGSTWTFQLVFRDAGAIGAARTNTSRAFVCTFRP